MSTVACPSCDLRQRVPPLDAGGDACCPRCGDAIETPPCDRPDVPLALIIAAGIAFIVANTAPLMGLSAGGRQASTSIIGGSYAMWRHGHEVTAVVVAFCTVIAPALYIALVLAVLLAMRRSPTPDWVGAMRHWSAFALRWSMPEVMLLGVLVGLIKIAAIATASPDIGMYAVGALVVLLAAIRHTFDPREVRTRQRDSVQHTWALLIAAAICYVPANTLPVATTNTLASSESDTIIGGVIYLYTSGSWPLALIVLIASVMIPVGKLIALAYLLIGVQRGASDNRRERTRLYRIVELIGRWSMLDVFVVTFVTALVQLEPLMSAQPGPGLPFFAAVVILTMLAARSFDARLIWDAGDTQHPAHG